MEVGEGGDGGVECDAVRIEGAQDTHSTDAGCITALDGGFWPFAVQGQGDLWAVAAGGLERLQGLPGGVGGGAPATHTETVVAARGQGAVAVPRRCPGAVRPVEVDGAAGEVGFKSLKVAAAPGPGEQARRGAQHTRQDLFVERILCTLAVPFAQEVSCLGNAVCGLLGRVAKFVAFEVAVDGSRCVLAGLGHHLVPQVQLVGGLVPQVAHAGGGVRLLGRGEGSYDLGAFGGRLAAAAAYGELQQDRGEVAGEVRGPGAAVLRGARLHARSCARGACPVQRVPAGGHVAVLSSAIRSTTAAIVMVAV
ncbi:hypothetical protein [Streptomyces sp. NPDC048272]|uniref:hypothetical protein n=1 Tax=Streptomyces sp. NPDC048272 TaxID=3154616 RepID=UPI0034355CFF